MPKVAPIRDTDRGFKAMLARITKGVTQITVGVHAQDGNVAKKGDTDGVTLIDVAAAHEFGLGVPRRSFIADWQDENVELHNKQIAAMARAVLAGTVASADLAAERLANLWVGDVQKRIVAHIPPPLSPKTIARKKSSTPLIDTGQLRSSIAYAVNGKLHPSQAFETATKDRIKADKKLAKDVARAKKKERTALKRRAKKAITSAVRDLRRGAKKTVTTAKKRLTKAVAATRKRVAKATKKKRVTKTKKS